MSSPYSPRSDSVELHSIPGQEAPRPGPNSGDRCHHVSERKITIYATVHCTSYKLKPNMLIYELTMVYASRINFSSNWFLKNSYK